MKILELFTGVPRNVYVALAAVAILSASFGGGYLLGSRNEARIQIKEVEKRVYVPVKEIQEVQVRNVERERQYQAERDAARHRADSLRVQLNAAMAESGGVDDPSLRNVSLDSRVVGLLNEAIANGAPPYPTGVTPSEGDTIAVADLVNWIADAAEQYNATANQLNALIDWVEVELIQPQQ